MPPSATAQIRDNPVEVFAGNRAFAHQMYLTTQLIGSYNFNYRNNLEYNFANQYLRLGLSYKDRQFGLATDLVQENPVGLLPTNTGLFLRRLL